MTTDTRANLLIAFATGMTIGYGMQATGVVGVTGAGLVADGIGFGLINTGLWWVIWG